MSAKPALLADVSRETYEKLEAYSSLLLKWTRKINLIGPSTEAEVWERHVLDSAQIFELIPNDATSLADLGSGGGLPGLVLAILASEKHPGLEVTLVESDKRKAAFLATVVHTLELPAKVRTDRIELSDPLGADIVTARALAPLDRLLGYAKRHLAPHGSCLFLKGATHQKEVAAALETWRFEVDTHPSQTNPDSVILHIKEVSGD